MAAPPTLRRVIVLGAGPAGLTAAALLRRLSPALEVRLLERQDRDAWESRRAFPVGLWARACSVLDELGVATGEPHSRPVPDGSYLNRGGRLLSAPSLEVANGFPGGFLRFFPREAALLDAIAVAEPAVQVEFGCAGSADPDEFGCDLVVDATGLREGACRSSAEVRHRGYAVYRGVTTAPLRRVGSRLAFQTWGPGQRFAAVPLVHGSAWYATFVDGHPLAVAEPTPEQLDLGSSLLPLRRAFDGWHEPIYDLLCGTTLLERRAAMSSGFPWTSRPCGRGRVVRIGDAHFTHDPILAIGAGEGVCDAWELVQLLRESNLSADPRVLDGLWQELVARRLLRKRLGAAMSNVAQALGQTSWCSSRDLAMSMVPSALKRSAFDRAIATMAS